MPNAKLIEKINSLAHKERREGLTSAEKNEQQKLRRQYLDNIRQQIINGLEGAGYSKKNIDE